METFHGMLVLLQHILHCLEFPFQAFDAPGSCLLPAQRPDQSCMAALHVSQGCSPVAASPTTPTLWIEAETIGKEDIRRQKLQIRSYQERMFTDKLSIAEGLTELVYRLPVRGVGKA